MKKKLFSSLVIFILLTFIVGLSSVKAEDFVYIRQINYPLVNNYTLISPDEEVELNIASGASKGELVVKMMNIVNQEKINHYFTYPDDITPASDLYFLKFSPYNGDIFSSLPEITLKYEADNHYKEVYYYSWLNLSFEKIESRRDTINNTLTFTIPNKRSVMFALFNEPELIGAASWYVYPKYRGELITASRDFAIDSKIKVTNLYNDKEVIVTVKDYGPKKCEDWTAEEQEKMGPCQERILDLSRTAFLELATTTGVGIISQVKVTPIVGE